MKDTIYCRTTDKGVHSFYLSSNGTSYYLFSQDYRRGVNAYYRKGVLLDRALDYGRSDNDVAVIRTMGKLPSYIRYIEKEYGIQVLKKTAKKNAKHYNTSRVREWAEMGETA